MAKQEPAISDPSDPRQWQSLVDWLEEQNAQLRAQLKHMEGVAYERLNLFTTAGAEVERLKALLRESRPYLLRLAVRSGPYGEGAFMMLQRIDAALGEES